MHPLARVAPSPRYFRGLRVTASRGFFRRFKGRFAWGLVALSSSLALLCYKKLSAVQLSGTGTKERERRKASH